jgi:hypothetical protein
VGNERTVGDRYHRFGAARRERTHPRSLPCGKEHSLHEVTLSGEWIVIASLGKRGCQYRGLQSFEAKAHEFSRGMKPTASGRVIMPAFS